MREFSFNEIVNYATKCIICGKKTRLSMRSFYGFIIMFIEQDGMFVSKEKPNIPLENHKVILDTDGLIIKGQAEVDRCIGRSLTAEIGKTCRTCNFSAYFTYKSKEDTKIFYKKIPNFYLTTERVDYFQKNSRPVSIFKVYETPETSGRRGDVLYIKMGYKSIIRDLPPDTIDFNSIKNLKHMNRVINLVKTFQ